MDTIPIGYTPPYRGVWEGYGYPWDEGYTLWYGVAATSGDMERELITRYAPKS